MPHRILPKSPRLPKLPPFLERKVFKSGQTRGADDDEIYQNRVSRTSTVLIPYSLWTSHFAAITLANTFKKGYIVLLSPTDYFDRTKGGTELTALGLTLGTNALVFYETRPDWLRHNPEELGWHVATSRVSPLGGRYVARIAATTASGDASVVIKRGFMDKKSKGAGIRVYEYASAETVTACRDQLEALFWLCSDAEVVAVKHNMTQEDAAFRRNAILERCEAQGLLDFTRLRGARVLNNVGHTMCPLCLKELSGTGFVTRMQQALGREVLDLTVTEINLFHLEELRMGVFNHRPYNVGWGHHHCNVVVRDKGIDLTLHWMRNVVNDNIAAGYLTRENNGSGDA